MGGKRRVRPPIEPRQLLLAALTGRRDGKRNGPREYPAMRPGYVQLVYRDRRTARLLERNGLLERADDHRWRLPEDMAAETGCTTLVCLHSWVLTPFGRVVARACLARKI